VARRKPKARSEKTASKPRARNAPAKAAKASAKKAALQPADVIAVPDEPESAATDALVLPEALDSSSAGGIKDLLLARRGSPIVVDAGQVRRTGMQVMQILISAAQTWQADGQSYVVKNPTQEFLDTIALVGLSREQLLVEGCLG
jgi:chemotaxis protein CheX